MRLRRDPWGHPRGLALVTWVYIIWSLAPVILAIRFAFNEGRSRSTAQGWSLRWFWEDPTLSVFNDPSLRSALEQHAFADSDEHATEACETLDSMRPAIAQAVRGAHDGG